MPADRVIVPEKVRKKIHKLPQFIQYRLPQALLEIKNNPLVGTKLHGELDTYHKLRIGDYRMVYSFNSKTSTIVVLKIEHRQGVYR